MVAKTNPLLEDCPLDLDYNGKLLTALMMAISVLARNAGDQRLVDALTDAWTEWGREYQEEQIQRG